MKKLSKQERKQLYVCHERVRDCQTRLEAVRATLIRKSFLVEGLPDAFASAAEVMESVERLTNEIIAEDDNIKI